MARSCSLRHRKAIRREAAFYRKVIGFFGGAPLSEREATECAENRHPLKYTPAGIYLRYIPGGQHDSDYVISEQPIAGRTAAQERSLPRRRARSDDPS